MSILGLHDGHNAGAAILSESGEVLAAVEEERFSRIKNHDSRPGHDPGPVESIRYCLSQANTPLRAVVVGIAHPNELQRIAGRNFSDRVRGGQSQRLARAEQIGLSLQALHELPRTSQEQRVETLRLAASDSGVPSTVPMHYVDHHRAHAAGAFFLSTVREALVVTLDGKGDDLSGTVSTGRDARLERHLEIPTEDSLGHLYSAFTVACGLRPQRDEGKLQSMAASGIVSKQLWNWLESQFSLEQETGSVVGHLNDGLIVGPYPDRLPDLHNDLVRGVISGLRVEDAAATVQRFLERIVSEFVLWHLRAHGMRKLVVAGGVFANVTLNRTLAALADVECLEVHPAMTDAGIALGAAVSHYTERGIRPNPLTNTALGPSYDDQTVAAAFEAHGYTVTDPNDTITTAESMLARALARGEIVARFAGRAEYGPRALGQRSILAEAHDPAIPNELNRRLRRSTVMPFAPILRAGDLDSLFREHSALKSPLRFMTTAVTCTEKMRNAYPAVVHRDGTARPQVVKDDDLSMLIDSYSDLTGREVLINTSFNLHDEPMVCSPSDAALSARAAEICVVQIGRLVASRNLRF